MTYIITGKADLLNRLKEELVRNGYEFVNTTDGYEHIYIECFGHYVYYWPYATISVAEKKRKTELTPENYNEVLNKILDK